MKSVRHSYFPIKNPSQNAISSQAWDHQADHGRPGAGHRKVEGPVKGEESPAEESAGEGKAKETATKYQRYGPSSLGRTRVGVQAAELTDNTLNVFMQAHLFA